MTRGGPPDDHSAAALARVSDESGFTLIELLVALLIVGILAGIVISTVIQSRRQAGDASAKSLINSAQQAAMNYGLQASNGYASMTPAALKTLEPTINTAANGQAVLVNAQAAVGGYLLTVVSSTANTFWLTYTNGVVSRTCTVAAGNPGPTTGGGCRSGKW
jgi:prepilin-type N-terminal cleavage/methylation domain-containing protein